MEQEQRRWGWAKRRAYVDGRTCRRRSWRKRTPRDTRSLDRRSRRRQSGTVQRGGFPIHVEHRQGVFSRRTALPGARWRRRRREKQLRFDVSTHCTMPRRGHCWVYIFTGRWWLGSIQPCFGARGRSSRPRRSRPGKQPCHRRHAERIGSGHGLRRPARGPGQSAPAKLLSLAAALQCERWIRRERGSCAAAALAARRVSRRAARGGDAGN